MTSAPRTPFGPALDGARLTSDLGFEVAGDYGDPAGEYAALRAGAGIVDRSTRGRVVVAGDDALKFLHSLVSQDVASLTGGDAVHTLLLQPQGKLDADLRLLHTGREIWLDCEAGMGERVAAALNRFKIRVNADITDVSDASGLLTVAGPAAAAVVADATGLDAPGPGRHGTWGALRVLRADLPDGTIALDILGPLDELSAAWPAVQQAGAIPVGTDAYEAVRIEAGVPRQGLDTNDKTIPQEAFLERDAVSFTKGCFLGQELVCRIDTRGHVNKYLRGIVVLDAVQPPAGAEVVSGDGTVAGTVTSVAVSPGLRAPVALATVRREIDVPSTVTLQWPGGGARAEVRDLPLSRSTS